MVCQYQLIIQVQLIQKQKKQEIQNMPITWYLGLYYKYRDYPITHINNKYKRKELKNIYLNIYERLCLYFYIDIEYDHQLQLSQHHSLKRIDDLKSNINNNSMMQKFYSANYISINSKVFESKNKIGNTANNSVNGKMLKSQGQFTRDQKSVFGECELTQKSLASMKMFDKEDKPIDEQVELTKIKANNYLKLIMNTSRQIICSILVQQKQSERENNKQNNLMNEEGVEQDSNLYTELEIQSGKVQNYLAQFQSQNNKNLNNKISKIDEQEIRLEVIPTNNEQINFYFLEFCSNVQIQQFDIEQEQSQSQSDSHISKFKNKKSNNFSQYKTSNNFNNTHNNANDSKNSIKSSYQQQRLDENSFSICNHSRLTNRKKQNSYLKQHILSTMNKNSLYSNNTSVNNSSNTSSSNQNISPNVGSDANIIDQVVLQLLQKQLQSSHKILSKYKINGEHDNKNGSIREYQNYLSQQQKQNKSMNIIIETWLQIVTMLEKQSTIFEIVEELVKGIGNPYIQKINAYLYFTTLVNTKFILAKSVSKENFLWYVPQLLEGNKSLSDFRLQRSQNIIKVFDVPLDRYVYSNEAYSKIMQKWSHLGQIISQLLIQNPDIFWAKVFQSCCQRLDQYLDEKVQFCYSLIVLHERLFDEQLSLIKLPEWKRRYYQKCIKIILQRQVGCNLSQIPTNIKKVQMKSKISVGCSNRTINNYQCTSNANNVASSDRCTFLDSNTIYEYYDQKLAGSEQKISELKQWEKVVKQSVNRLRGYKKILDIGLKIFKGMSECVTIFFLQTYFNFKRISVVKQSQFMGLVNRYCYKLINSPLYHNFLTYNMSSSRSNPGQLPLNSNNQIAEQISISQSIGKGNKMNKNDIKIMINIDYSNNEKEVGKDRFKYQKINKNMRLDSSEMKGRQNEPSLIQLQIHKQNHKNLARQITQNYKYKQMILNKNQNHGASLSVNMQSNSGYNSNKNINNNSGMQQQSNYSQYQTNPQNAIPSEYLMILQEETISGIITKLIQINQGSLMEDPFRNKMIVQQINSHLKLINECNFILALIQRYQFGFQFSNNPNKSKNSQPKDKTGNTDNTQKAKDKRQNQKQQKETNIIILDTKQLNNSISKITSQYDQRNNILMMQTQNYRNNFSSTDSPNDMIGNSYPSKYRISSINVPTKKYSFVNQHSNDENRHRSQVDYDKITEKIYEHNVIVQLIINLYYKYTKFYKAFSGNIQCQQCCCCTKSEDPDQLSLPIHKIHAEITQEKYKKQNMYRNMTAKKIINYVRKYQNIYKNCHRSKSKSQVLQFQSQLRQAIQLNNMNNQILMIFMFVASLEVDSSTFLAIYKRDLISQQKLEKVKVIGKIYYSSIHSLFTKNKKCGQLLMQDQSFELKKNMYLQNFLVILIGLIQVLYDRTQDCNDLVPFISLLINYFVSKTFNASNTQKHKSNQELINFTKIISQCFDWNQQNLPDIGEKDFILRLLQLRTTLENPKIIERIRYFINLEFKTLSKYQAEKQKVYYLQMKINYLMMREIYFDCYYDIGVFEVKSSQARKNFQMYQAKMLIFFQQIIVKDQKQFLQHKSQELKQRSAHLKGYLRDYQKQPECHEQQRKCLIKTVCIFDKTLNLLTQNKQFQMKKRGSNSISVQRKNKQKNEPIYMHYVSTQFLKPNKQRVKVFENQTYFFFRAIQIYQNMLCKKIQDSSKKYSIYKQLGFSVPTTTIYSNLQEKDLKIIKNNKESLLALWINFQYRNLHETKMILSHQNLLSKIQKLYIDLDVRHKVFQSFKDKILNYEMQKTKIYHQYMDYIRGLKLDVYSHITGEDPFPYFKLVNAIKFYRLDIKKKQLEQKVNEQFGKNLGKWNEGIGKDIHQYHQWVKKEMVFWQNLNEGSNKNIKQLFQIYAIVNKQLKRHQHKIQQVQITNKQNNNVNNFDNRHTLVNKSNKIIQSRVIKKSLHKQKSLLSK